MSSTPVQRELGDTCDCSNSRGISLLSVVGKLYRRVLFTRGKIGTECATG